MADWNAQLYETFKNERTLPARDLAAAVGQEPVTRALDVGCGTGTSTAVLRVRFPEATLFGVDQSDAMLQKARFTCPGVTFRQMDISGDLSCLPTGYDLIFSNACLQWVPDHPALLPKLMALLRKGGVLAVQIPQQRKHPVHRLIRQLAASDKWAGHFSHQRAFYGLPEEDYYRLLSSLSTDFRLWETTYFHVMPSHQSIVEWYKGTGLRPYLAQLSEDESLAFQHELLQAIEREFPLQPDGHILFPFPRLFFTARKS